MANEYLYGAYGHMGETVVQSAVQAGTTPVYIGTAPVNLVRGFADAGVINEPIKTAEDAEGNLYIEVHQPLSMNEEEFETLDKNLPFTFTKEQQEFFARPEVNQDILHQALSERSGRVVLLNPPEF